MLLLDWIDTLGLLPQDPDSNILDVLGEGAKRAIVLETLGQVCGPASGELFGSSLKTIGQLRFVLEIAGQAFGLGLDDLGATEKAVGMYLGWLFGDVKKPVAVGEADVDGFRELLLRHLSVLFAVKKGGDARPNGVLIAKHIELCKGALKAFVRLAMEGPALADSTWRVLIRVVLGVADSLLRLPLLPPCYLADGLAEHLLATCLEVFLRSRTRSASLWKALRSYYQRWCHRIAAVNQWAAISLALTQRISKHLYGQGTDLVVYTVHGQPVELDLGADFEMFAWRFHLGLIASPSELPANGALRAVYGIERMMGVFYSVGITLDHGTAAENQFPDGNTLLAVYGRWLFEAAALQGPDQVECAAYATGILCRLFSKPQHRVPFHSGYLHQFYRTISTALANPNLLMVVFVVVNAEELLAARLPGVRVLAMPFLAAIRRIVPQCEPAALNVRMEDLRRACFKLLGTLLGFANHFSELVPCVDDTQVYLTNTYSEALARILPQRFRFVVVDTLVSCLIVEADGGNQRYLISSLAAFVIDASPQSPPLVGFLAKVLVELSLAAFAQDPATLLTALQALRHLSDVHDGSAADGEESHALEVVGSVCEIIASIASRASIGDFLPAAEFGVDVLVDWLASSPSVFSGEAIRWTFQTVQVLFAAPPTRQLAKLAVSRIFGGVGLASANPCFPTLASSRLTEFDFSEAGGQLSYFLLNGTSLVCFIETPTESGDDMALVAVLRTATGRFTWSSKLLLNAEGEGTEKNTATLWREFREVQKQMEMPGCELKEEPLFNDDLLNKHMDAKRSKDAQLIADLSQRQIEALPKSRLKGSPAFSGQHYQASPLESQRDHLARLLLVQLGLASPENIYLVQPLQPVTEDLYAAVHALDDLPERDVISISVFFVRSGLQSLPEILAEQRISTDFLQFVHSLAWPIDNQTNPDLADLGTTIPYYANGAVEAVFHVPSLMPVKSHTGDAAHLAERLGEILEPDTVCIVWLEDPIDMLSLPGKFGAPNVLVYICVCPLRDEESVGLYRIRVMATQAHHQEGEEEKQAGLVFGPLLDGMLLRREMLGSLVRSTAISAALFAARQVRHLPRPMETRAAFIAEMAESFAVPVHPVRAPQDPEAFYHFYDSMLFGGKAVAADETGGGLVSSDISDSADPVNSSSDAAIGEITRAMDTISVAS